MGPTSREPHLGTAPPRRTVVIAVVATVRRGPARGRHGADPEPAVVDGQVAASPVAWPRSHRSTSARTARQQRRWDAGDGAGDDPGGPGEGDARHDDQPRARRLPRGVHHRARRAPGRRSSSRGRRPGRTGRGATAPCCTAPDAVVIDHSWITLDGFTVDGQEQLAVSVPHGRAHDRRLEGEHPGPRGGRAAGLHRLGRGVARPHRDHDQQHVPQRPGGECVRLRNNAHGNTVVDSVIQYCGCTARATGRSGPSTTTARRPTSAPAPSRTANRCPTTTPARTTSSRATSSARSGRSASTSRRTRTTTCSKTTCSSNASPREFEGSNVELRGYANIVRNNQISDSAGYSIKIQTDGEEYDRGGNVVENNQLSGAAAETFKIKSDASQGRFCGNSIVASGRCSTPTATARCRRGSLTPADPLRAAPARVVVDSGNGRLRYRVNPGAAMQRWIRRPRRPCPCGRRPHGRGGAHLARLWLRPARWPPAPYRRTTPRTPSAGAGSTRRPITAA